MVLHEDKLRDANLIIDFFRDSDISSFSQQLIAYHDEAQIELTKDLVKFKMFDTEEEANNFSDGDNIWSDVGHSPNGKIYRAYSVVGQLAAEAVVEAGQYYNLSIELTAGYMIGRNWGECH